MRVPKNRLGNITFQVVDTFMTLQISDQPCAPNFVDPATIDYDSNNYRALCQFVIYTSSQTVYVNPSPKCAVPTVPDGGYYYVNMKPIRVTNGAFTLDPPNLTDRCLTTMPDGSPACTYRLNY